MNNSTNSKVSLRAAGIFFVILLLAVSATWGLTRDYYKNEATDRAFLRLDSSLNNVSHFFQASSRNFAYSLNEKLKYPPTVEKASYWKPIVNSALIHTDHFYEFLEVIRQQLLTAIINAIREPIDLNKQREVEIFQAIKKFSSDLINLIPPDKRPQLSVLPIKKYLLNSNNSENKWIENYFEGLSPQAKLATISAIQTDVLASANIIAEFANSQSESLVHYCEFPFPLVTQNSTALLSGEMLEITAGITTYSCSFNPIITIDNKKISPNEEQMFVYKKRITGGKGGSVPVIISFRDPNTGETKTLSKQISYNVIQPK